MHWPFVDLLFSIGASGLAITNGIAGMLHKRDDNRRFSEVRQGIAEVRKEEE